MVYQDYDEDEQHAFDTEQGPVAVGNVGPTKARTSTMVLRKKCLGLPVCVWGGLFMVGVMAIGLIASKASTPKEKEVAVAPPTPPPTPAPTPTPTPLITHKNLQVDSKWIQHGNDIGGISVKGNSGISVGISYDGRYIAEGTNSAAGDNPKPGHVRVYEYKDATQTWEMVGNEIVGLKHGDEFGYALDLSQDGKTVIVGAPGAYRHGGVRPNVGYFSVYGWNETIQDWSQVGPYKFGEGDDDRQGTDLCINKNGEVLVVGSPGSSRNFPGAGEVRVFEYSYAFGRWLRHGQELTGHREGDQFGWSVAVSNDGDVVAAGAPFAEDDGDTAQDTGHVQIFKFLYVLKEDGKYERRFHRESRTLKGRDAGDHFGYSISMSSDGSIIAAGAPNAPVGGSPAVGYVDVYKLTIDEEGEKWKYMGHTIWGKNIGEGFGKSVELSDDGKVLTVGAPDGNDSRGTIRSYMFNEEADTWEQIGSDVEGDGPFDLWGSAVASSGDGRVILSGGNNYLGALVGETHVRVYRGS
mmetsp:Transcript_12580/g.24158  ORF Transcript_12580/g.24158 Transcript_12580/m.24158 type:complete len:522 (+) Transcript_12580:221-1786(+)|eukprot:scaffold1332_cov166-Amphora_coffeaeformis.AAC.11